jgi:ribonuclease P protein component
MPERTHDGAPRRRAGRLSRSAEFDRVYRHGRSVANRYLVLYAFPRGDDAEARIGLSVGRRVGGAVERNRIKRLLREGFRAHSPRLPRGHDLVAVARPDARELAQAQGLTGVAGAVEELLDKAGLASGERDGTPVTEPRER